MGTVGRCTLPYSVGFLLVLVHSGQKVKYVQITSMVYRRTDGSVDGWTVYIGLVGGWQGARVAQYPLR